MSGYLAQLHNDAMLAAVTAAAAGFAVGDAVKPDGTALPYAVVYPLGSPTFDGSLAVSDLDDDAWPTTQVTFVGVSRQQVDGLRDRVRALLGTYVVVEGRRVGPIRLHDERPIERDDDVTPPLLYAVDRYRPFSTSAA